MIRDCPFGVQSTSHVSHTGTADPPDVGNARVTWFDENYIHEPSGDQATDVRCPSGPTLRPVASRSIGLSANRLQRRVRTARAGMASTDAGPNAPVRRIRP